MKRLLSVLALLLVFLCGCTPKKEERPKPTEALKSDPYIGMTAEEFYADYTPATSLKDAQYRSKHGFLSGSLEVPDQEAERSQDQPMLGDLYIHNTHRHYEDNGDTYVVTDSQGNEGLRIYKGGGYITLEEVAAYMYAFGGVEEDLPANYTTKKSGKPATNKWGQYLRLNHSYFKNNPYKYPYEPELPGNGDGLRYYEMDIGTTGTATPGYAPKMYNDGSSITRGAARLVYTRQDVDGSGVIEDDEVCVFYTHNHYNDFTHYLNYYGGWGETFGNVTGGGVYNSDTECNPTPYPTVAYDSFAE
jgi:hypothetical protein